MMSAWRGGGKTLEEKLSWVGFLLPCTTCLFLHFVIPGGLVQEHNLVIFITSLVLYIFHIFTASQNTCNLLSGSALSIASFSLLAILFGAQMFRWRETLVWSLLMAALVCLPVMQLPAEPGDNLLPWQRIFLIHQFRSRREHRVFLASFTTLVATWMAATPLLLDWNTPWQVWPLPCSVGALFGSMCGLLVGRIPLTSHVSEL